MRSKHRRSQPIAGLVVSALVLASCVAFAAPPPARLHLLLFAADGASPAAGGRCTLSDADGRVQTLVADRRGAMRASVAAGRLRLACPPAAEVAFVAAPGSSVEVVAVLDVATPVQVEGAAVARSAQVSDTCASARTATLETVSKQSAQVPDTCANAAPGTIEGEVRDARGGKPLVGARIFARGRSTEVRSGPGGRFRLELPAGSHDLVVLANDHASRTLRGVAVVEGTTTRLEVALPPAGLELEAMEVRAPRIEGSALSVLDERRKSAAVADIVGAEQMAKGGDSDAAGAARRVTGVTVVGGRYVYVRGLGERYASTMLDGATLPSTDTERRVVPLDLFPTGSLDSLAVQKTYSPDLPGEFGGGAVLLRTRAAPKSLTASAQIGIGLRLGTTFQGALRAEGGSTDVLGFDGGTRALPGPVAEASAKSPLLERDQFGTRGYTASQLEKLGESMRAFPTLRHATLPIDTSFSGTIGGPLTLGGWTGGAMLSLSWGDAWQRRLRDVKIQTVGEGGSLETAHRYAFEAATRNVDAALLGVVELRKGEQHALRSLTMVSRLSEDEARRFEGFNRDVATEIRVDRTRWIEQMLVVQQLHGEHSLPRELSLRWHAGVALASRLEPDRATLRYDREHGTDRWLLSDRPDGNRRVFSELSDRGLDGGVRLRMPWDRLGKDGAVEVGLAAADKSRDVDTRRYRLMHKGPLANDPSVLVLPAGELFAPHYIGPDGFQLEENTLPTDSYLGEQRVFGGFAMADATLLPGLTLRGGVRLEAASLAVTTYQPFQPDATPIRAAMDSFDPLPALTLTWRFRERQDGSAMALRFGAARTVARPDLREMSPATFNDVTGGRQIFGNPDLGRARIDHLDLRWEWYPQEGASLSLGIFGKRFQDPIETIVVPSAQLSVTYQNAKGALSCGVELEGRLGLATLFPGVPGLSGLWFSGNAALIASRVDVSGAGTIQTSKVRPLQGQSPWVGNLATGWDNDASGTTVALSWNAFGARIVEVGALGAPDVYEQPRPTFDVVLGQSLGGGWKVGVKASNLLDSELALTQGDVTVDRSRSGRRFSLSISRSL